jgi:tol-pal system protein YbgF
MASMMRAVAAATLVLACGVGHAGLFDDDEARRAILELRQRIDANRQANEELRTLIEESTAPTRRGLLDLVNQLTTLRAEVAQLRGQNEALAREVAELQRQQKEVLGSVDKRLRVLEPVKVSIDGVEFMAQPDEQSAFEAAMQVLRASDFPRATQLYSQFVQRYPESGYVPLALYWQGNAQYAQRDYKPAIDSYLKMVARAPAHPRVPEAKLAMANCQLELKDTKSAKTTLQNLLRDHPNTEAGATAKDRLARMK